MGLLALTGDSEDEIPMEEDLFILAPVTGDFPVAGPFFATVVGDEPDDDVLLFPLTLGLFGGVFAVNGDLFAVFEAPPFAVGEDLAGVFTMESLLALDSTGGGVLESLLGLLGDGELSTTLLSGFAATGELSTALLSGFASFGELSTALLSGSASTGKEVEG